MWIQCTELQLKTCSEQCIALVVYLIMCFSDLFVNSFLNSLSWTLNTVFCAVVPCSRMGVVSSRRMRGEGGRAASRKPIFSPALPSCRPTLGCVFVRWLHIFTSIQIIWIKLILRAAMHLLSLCFVKVSKWTLLWNLLAFFCRPASTSRNKGLRVGRRRGVNWLRLPNLLRPTYSTLLAGIAQDHQHPLCMSHHEPVGTHWWKAPH